MSATPNHTNSPENANSPELSSGGNPQRIRLVLAIACWGYFLLILAAWPFLRAADHWWPATLLAFAPRWWLVAPLVVLVPTAFWLRRRLLWPLLLSLVGLLGPVMGLCVSWRTAGKGKVRLRVLTCNMHYGRPAPDKLNRLLLDTSPDIVALQEWGGRPEVHSAFLDSDWHFARSETLFLASKFPIRRFQLLDAPALGDVGTAAWYELEVPGQSITVFSLHFTSPREGLLEVRRGAVQTLQSGSDLRRAQSGALARAAERKTTPVILMGDFNTPPESVIFREELQDYRDAFRDAGLGWGWTFRAGKVDVRIDYVRPGSGWHTSRCWVGPNVGSAHRPVIADLVWEGRKR